MKEFDPKSDKLEENPCKNILFTIMDMCLFKKIPKKL